MNKILLTLLILLFFKSIKSYSQNTVFDIDNNQYQTVLIDGKEWLSSNLNVSHYKNGDPIKQAMTEEEWKECAEKKIGCWCYFENDSTNSFAKLLELNQLTKAAQEPNSFGKLYNWYSINDPRGMGVDGFKVPTKEDWNSLMKYGCNALKSKTGWQILVNLIYSACDCKGYDCNGNNNTGFNAKGSGYRNYIGIWDDYGSFYEGFIRALFWADFNKEGGVKEVKMNSKTIVLDAGAIAFGIGAYEDDSFWKASTDHFFAKGDGLSVRLIKMNHQ